MRRFSRFRGSLLLPPAMAIVFLAIVAGPAGATSPNPVRPRATAAHAVSSPNGAITAVVVKSWGACSSSGLIWDSLNANWSSYGTIPISIDYSNPALCGDSFSLADLEASGANVVILDDPAGGNHQFTTDEMNALRTYASEGHNLIGTYLVFAWSGGGIDNGALAPLFGLRMGAYAGGTETVTPTYMERKPNFPLFRGVGNPYVSTGYNAAQTPADGAWSANELLSKTLMVGRTADAKGTIVAHQGTGYYSVYISNMPEYNGGTADQQFFYNAIIFPQT